MKAITRREMFKELVSKDTIKMVAGSWYGFTKPFMAEKSVSDGPKKGSLLEVVKRMDAKHMKHDRKEG
jgi:2-keto-4-pentenoate hydratase